MVFIFLKYVHFDIGQTPTPPSTTSVPSEAEQSFSKSSQSMTSGSSTVSIIAGVIVGIILIVTIVGIAFFIFQRRRADKQELKELDGEEPPDSKFCDS